MTARRVRDGSLYGWGRPTRWPRGTWWPFGPSHPNDGREVTVFASGRTFTLRPAELPGHVGHYRGHRYDGTLRPAAADLEPVLVDAGVEAELAATDAVVLAAVSAIEGGFDALQTYDSARFSWGFVQFAATGGLVALLHAMESEAPVEFDRYFRRAGIGAAGTRLVVESPDGRRRTGWRAINRLHDDPDLWRPFLVASLDPEVQRTQVLVAHRNYVARSRTWTILLDGRRVALLDVVGADPVGPAAAVDHAIHRGPAYTIRLFERAAIDAGVHTRDLGTPATARAVLTAARRLEPSDDARWAALQTAVDAGGAGSPATAGPY